MAEDALLSELCAICHLNLPKYKCPRCTIRTCSLACVKRHKLWSQCSGARDPAAYRKRHELATPASIDQDYNFITRVERTVERAANATQDRGIVVREDRSKRAKGEARRNAEIEQRQAIMLKAPAGMSRALQNRSKWDNRQRCLIWTVEWVLEDGSKVVGNCQESRTVMEAFVNAVGSRKTKRLQSRPSKALCTHRDLDSKSDNEGSKDCPVDSAARVGPAAHVPNHFYLHRPNLPSPLRCVIPIRSDSRVKDVVQGRVLVEFPTIFVLGVSEEKLQQPFITEDDYTKEYGNESPKVRYETLQRPCPGSDRDQQPSGLNSLLKLDEKQIGEVLQRDLGT